MTAQTHSAQFILAHPTRNPDEVTTAVGVPPTTVERVGDVVRTSNNSRGLRAKRSTWTLASDIKNVRFALKELLEQLEPRWSVVVELCKTWQPTLVCSIQRLGYDEELPIPQEMLTRFAAIGTYVQIRVVASD